VSRIKTSESHPIQVNFVDVPDAKGRLGLTFAPGKNHNGMTARWRRDLQTDLERLKERYGADVLVSLLEGHELRRLQIEHLLPRAHRCGLKVIRYPMKKAKAPYSSSSARTLTERIVDLLREGETVVIFCGGGLGRTGTIAACCLVQMGERPERAIQIVRRSRHGTIETERQKRFVHESYEALHREKKPGDPIVIDFYEAETVGVESGPTDGNSWKTKPTPENKALIRCALTLSPAQMERVQFGYKPLAMEDKWFIYWGEPWLHFHRSWTGNEVFRVRFEEHPEGWQAIETWANRDPEQYEWGGDEHDACLVLWLIGALLLEYPIPFPPYPGSGDEGEEALRAWGLAGPAAFGDLL